LDPRRLVRGLRWATIAAALGAALYLGGRFEVVTLPSEGCSPVARYVPGVRLLVDRWARTWQSGDCVFVSDAAGAVHLVLLAECDATDAWWTRSDVDACPGAAGDELGWVPADRLLGRVLLGM
jgi:hypothetical protein